MLSALAAILALNAWKLYSNSMKQKPDRVKVGFAKCSLVPAIKSFVVFRRRLESVCAVIKDNNTCIAFMHSETMAKISLELRNAFPGLNLIPVCLTSGSTQYIPTSEIIDMGGYEGMATITCRDGEEKIRKRYFNYNNRIVRGLITRINNMIEELICQFFDKYQIKSSAGL